MTKRPSKEHRKYIKMIREIFVSWDRQRLEIRPVNEARADAITKSVASVRLKIWPKASTDAIKGKQPGAGLALKA